jgi:rhodanese-related sulfurtransferase
VAAGSQTAVRTLLFALAVFAVVAFLPRLLRRLRRADERWIDAATLEHRLDHGDGPLVVDVRGADEFNGPLGHIRTARNIPLNDLLARLPELQAWRRRGLMLVCRTDKRSAKAAELLKQAGFADVRVVRGGMQAWNRHGLPTASDANP